MILCQYRKLVSIGPSVAGDVHCDNQELRQYFWFEKGYLRLHNEQKQKKRMNWRLRHPRQAIKPFGDFTSWNMYMETNNVKSCDCSNLRKKCFYLSSIITKKINRKVLFQSSFFRVRSFKFLIVFFALNLKTDLILHHLTKFIKY